MAKKGIETELRETLDVHPGKTEDRQKFLGRLMKAGKTCHKDVWASLSEAAGKYANALIDAYDDEKAYPEPPDHNPGSTNEKETGDMAKNAKSGNKSAGAKDTTKGSAKDAPKKGAATASPAKKPAAGKSSRAKIKEAIVKNPRITLEKLVDTYGTGKNALGKDGLTELSIGSIRSDTLNTLRVADAAGCWKGPALD